MRENDFKLPLNRSVNQRPELHRIQRSEGNGIRHRFALAEINNPPEFVPRIKINILPRMTTFN